MVRHNYSKNNNKDNSPRNFKRKDIPDDLIAYRPNKKIKPNVIASLDLLMAALNVCAENHPDDFRVLSQLNKQFFKEFTAVCNKDRGVRFSVANTLRHIMPPLLILASPGDFQAFSRNHNVIMKNAHKVVACNPVGSEWPVFLNSSMRNVEIRGKASSSSNTISFPNTINTLFIDATHSFSSIIGPGIRTLTLSHVQIPLETYPNSLTKLRLSDEFNFNLDNLPLSLHELYLGSNYNHPIDHLPPCLVTLDIGGVEGVFNQSVNHLPASLVSLIVTSTAFNCSLHHLPVRIRTLIVTNPEYKHPINLLPQSITELTIGAPVTVHALPRNIIKLHMHLDEHNTLSAALPSLYRVSHLSIAAYSFRGAIFVPGSVKELTVTGNCSLANIPATLNRLTITNRKADERVKDLIPQIPGAVCHLQLPDKFDAPLGSLPRRGLKTLVLGGYYDQPLDNLPETILHIRINHQYDSPQIDYNHSLDSLPPHLLSFHFAGYPAFFNHTINNLPQTLEVLRLCGIPNRRAVTIRQPLCWRFGGAPPRKTRFNQSLMRLPANLRELAIGDAFMKPVMALPPKLLTLVIYGEPRHVEVPTGAEVLFIRLPDI